MDYYQRIKQLNITHYTGEVPYYSKAPLRKVESTILEQLSPNASLLDLGCGSGRFSIGAAARGFKTTGIDITPAAIYASKNRATREHLTNTRFLVGDMTELQFSHNSFEYVFCPRFSINAVATYAKRQKAIDEMLRVVKPGGKVFIESFNKLYFGRGPVLPMKNIYYDSMRSLRLLSCKLSGSEYHELLPGDIIYQANKTEGATVGYAHLPTVWELRKLIPKGHAYSLHSIPEIMEGHTDLLKLFRYSIWIFLTKG